MSIRNIFITVFSVLVHFNCKPQKVLLESEDEIYKIVNLRLKNFGTSKIYYKSYIDEEYNKSFVQGYLNGYYCGRGIKYSRLYRKKRDSIEHIQGIAKNKKEQMIISLVKKNTVRKVWENDHIPQKEVHEIANGFIEQVIKWDKKKIDNYFNLATKKKKSVSFSVPAFNNDHTLSFMLVKFPNSLQGEVYRKENNNWYLYCSFLISTSN